jgi:hypothetical protein
MVKNISALKNYFQEAAVTKSFKKYYCAITTMTKSSKKYCCTITIPKKLLPKSNNDKRF